MRRRRSRFRKVQPVLFGVATLLLGYSLVQSSPSILVRSSADLLGSAIVGVSAGVGQNSDNVLARQLAEKEAELLVRETRLESPILRKSVTEVFFENSALYSFGLSSILFVLLIINYVMDWRRSRKREVSGARIIVS